jgi:hypothetical protein
MKRVVSVDFLIFIEFSGDWKIRVDLIKGQLMFGGNLNKNVEVGEDCR